MASGGRRFVLQQLDQQSAANPSELPLAVVKSVVAGGAADSNALVTVTYMGTDLALPYFSHYTPVVGHKVGLVKYGGVWTIIGRPIGFPA